MRGRWTQRAAIVILGLVLSPLTSQAAFINITPSLSTVGVGDTFAVNVHVTQGTPVVDISPWNFDLKYNPLLLRAESVTEGSPGFSLLTPGFIDQTSGLISGTAGFFSGLPPAPSEGDLAVVHFKALGLGVSPLELQNLLLNFDSGVTPANAGTLGLTNEIQAAITEQIVEQAIATGFTTVVILNDHGGGLNVYTDVAKKLEAKYRAPELAPKKIHVFYADHVYAKAQGDFDETLKQRHLPVSGHAGIPDTSEMMYLGKGKDWVRTDLLKYAVTMGPGYVPAPPPPAPR